MATRGERSIFQYKLPGSNGLNTLDIIHLMNGNYLRIRIIRNTKVENVIVRTLVLNNTITKLLTFKWIFPLLLQIFQVQSKKCWHGHAKKRQNVTHTMFKMYFF